ncbi:glycosyltransferase family 4 protein [Pseudooceanicola sp. LIPI14-2-Ac024]|uniref:glycosyltransferase family 4 protein n=1 Tax=Pseudooceanicola sp. LIPI14-2-Ac024 TaxID=3344875 RepID=UPI0035D059F0
MIRIAHLVDDTTPGGVTRYLDFIRQDPGMTVTARHEVAVVSRVNPARRAVDADIIVSHLGLSWRGLPGLMALRARHAGIPLIHVEHSYSEGFVAANVTARGRFCQLLRTAYSLFDEVVAVSEAQKDWLQRRDLVAADALRCIPPCVDLAPFRAVPPPPDGVTTIGAIGRFDAQKGFDILIRAFRQVDDAALRLVLIGQGQAETTLRNLADGDDRIRFPGFTDSPAQAYGDCDVIAMPSRWEPYGLVALEANAAGRPVLMSSVDGLRNQVDRGNVVVAENTAVAWAGAIRALAASPITRPSVERAQSQAKQTSRAWADLVAKCTAKGLDASARLRTAS